MEPSLRGMAFASACEVALFWSSHVPDVPGVYAVLLEDSEALLRKCGYFSVCRYGKPPLVDGMLLANIGMSRYGTLRERINDHLLGTCRASSMRRSIAVLFGPDAMAPIGDPGHHNYHFGEEEMWITKFLLRHAYFGWRASDDPIREEYDLIQHYRPLLNIHGVPREGFVKHLFNLRKEWANAATR